MVGTSRIESFSSKRASDKFSNKSRFCNIYRHSCGCRKTTPGQQQIPGSAGLSRGSEKASVTPISTLKRIVSPANAASHGHPVTPQASVARSLQTDLSAAGRTSPKAQLTNARKTPHAASSSPGESHASPSYSIYTAAATRYPHAGRTLTKAKPPVSSKAHPAPGSARSNKPSSSSTGSSSLTPALDAHARARIVMMQSQASVHESFDRLFSFPVCIVRMTRRLHGCTGRYKRKLLQ